MTFLTTAPGMEPKILERAIMLKFRQAATAKDLLMLNPIDSYVIETTEESGVQGGFNFVDRDTGIPELIQRQFKKATRNTVAWDASIKITKADTKVRPDLVSSQINLAGQDWATFDDQFAYGKLLAGAGIIEDDLTAWSDADSTPVEDVSLARATMGKETKGNMANPDTMILNNMAWHYLAISAKLINQDYTPTGAGAYTLTGRIPALFGMKIIVSEAVGNDVLILKSKECGKWDQFLAPTTITTEGKFVRQPLIHTYHDMYEWGYPSVTQPKYIAKLSGVGAVE